MEAHSLSPQSLLHADDSHSSPVPNIGLEGDFGAGVRRLAPPVGAGGDFATGMRSAPLGVTLADFATGQRTCQADAVARGDFATGQHAERSDRATRDSQPVRPRLPRLEHNAATGV
jgi:hypothetical protein